MSKLTAKETVELIFLLDGCSCDELKKVTNLVMSFYVDRYFLEMGSKQQSLSRYVETPNTSFVASSSCLDPTRIKNL